MDEVDDDNFYGSKGLGSPDSTTYYLYAFAATSIVGLPLLFVALYKIYMDHQHHQDEQYAYREKMMEYREAKQGLTVNLHLWLNIGGTKSVRKGYNRLYRVIVLLVL